ncbi:MAG: M48 family metalloprotease [Candidatus Omnitrophota bacterium]
MKIRFLLLLILTLGCVTVYNPATQREEFYFIDTNTEVVIGKNIAGDIIKENKLITDKSKLNYLRSVGEKIARVSDRAYLQYEFYILDQEGINAFTLPGGYIFVNSDLLDKSSEDELAFVLAHEIGHVAARHSIKRLQATMGINLILSLALKDVDNILINNAVDIVYNAVSMGFARSDEFLADSLAVKYSDKAGYPPSAGISLMEKLKKEKTDDFTLIFLSSHPPVEDRIANIREKMNELKLVKPGDKNN